MKALRILLVAAMAMMMVSSVFAQDHPVVVNGEAEYSVEFENKEVGDADAVTKLMLGDGGRISLQGLASKDLDNGATVEVSTRFDIKYDEFGKDYIRLKYMNGPLTVQMLKADRPGIINKGLDKYVPEGPWYAVEATSERDVSFKYAGEGMTFTTTVNFKGSNYFAVRPHVAIPLGSLTAELAAEYATEFPQDTDADGPGKAIYGGGAALEGSAGAISFGVSGAYGIEGNTDADGNDADDISTMSGYAFMKMGVGAGTVGLAGGYNLATSDSYAEDKTSVQANATFEFGNVMVPGLTVKGGAGFAAITDENDVETNKTGGKVVLAYGF